MNRDGFVNPALEYRMKTIVHSWPEKCEVLADAIKEFGYGGTATNPEQRNGYTSNPENLKSFDNVIDKLKEKGLGYWIYDEKGYPSGYGGGLSLEEHPELESKGFYMRRFLAIQPKTVEFLLDDQSDKIVWACKYPVDHSVTNSSIIQYEQMIPVEFSKDKCVCELKENEIFFVFCVKSAYEGSHLTHNVCSRSRYINLLDEKAVRRFLDVCYEPIVNAIPDAYKNAEAVFTDEPSLQTTYIQGDEVWPYALAPWVDGLFEKFEAEYGYSIRPYLPQIFEGRVNAYTTRVHFYNLIGKMIAKSYVTQIADWCKEHGTKFSGHYLAEESLLFHVLYYGSYLEVLKATDYPGVDVLASYPQIYHYNTTRYAQMAARKNGTNGIMVELCPFIDMEHFEKSPTHFSTGILNLLYLGGCRCINSYFSSNFASYNPEILGNYGGYMSQEQAQWLNAYVGRLGYVLDETQNDCDTFIYYPLEEAQAKTRPAHCAQESVHSAVDASIVEVTKAVYEAGYDYMFADKDDLCDAVKNCGKISGCTVKNIIVPAMDVIYPETYDALVKLQEAGVNVYFMNKVPAYRVGYRCNFKAYDFREEAFLGWKSMKDEHFSALTVVKLLAKLDAQKKEFTAELANGNTEEAMFLKARYEKENKIIYFIVNNTENKVDFHWKWTGHEKAEVWDPEDGTITVTGNDETVQLNPYRGKFFVVEK